MNPIEKPTIEIMRNHWTAVPATFPADGRDAALDARNMLAWHAPAWAKRHGIVATQGVNRRAG